MQSKLKNEFDKIFFVKSFYKTNENNYIFEIRISLLLINPFKILIMKKLLILLVTLTFINISYSQIISQGAVWKYLDDGSNQGTAWRMPGFDDSGWASGNAQLGYGDGDEATVISYGGNPSNKYITYYFRKTISVSNPDEQNGLKVEILRDDGAVVYINGTEVVRSNMPDGNITYLTHAAHTVAGGAEDQFFVYQIPSSYLVQGNNVVAVEIHQRSPTSSDVSFDFKLSFTQLSPFKIEPYVLYPGDNTKMMVLWQLSFDTQAAIALGDDTNYTLDTIYTEEYNSDHQHMVTFEGLTPGQNYFYKVMSEGVSMTGSFRAGADNTSSKISFYAYGDTRTYPNKHDLVAERILNTIEQYPESNTFVVSSGDLVEDGDNLNDWYEQFFNPEYEHIAEMLANLPYLTAMGNHEGQGYYFGKFFPYPMYQNGKYYYSFDYGNIHFTVLDQEIAYGPGSTQYNWLVNDLATSNKPWKILLFHKPGWSAGGHSNNSTVQNYIQPLCLQYNVQYCITGHNHYYARADVDGVQHITTGGGGAPLYDPNPNMPHIVKVDKSNHFCKLDVDGDTLTFTAIRANGSVIESFQTVQDFTGVSESNILSDVKVYSFNKSIRIVNHGNSVLTVSIYDITGKLIYKNNITGTINDIAPHVKGVVLVNVLSEKGKSLTEKVILE